MDQATQQNKVFLLVGTLDGALIIATGIGLWFATANPFRLPLRIGGQVAGACLTRPRRAGWRDWQGTRV